MKVFSNYDLSALNTFRMKVKCARFVEYESVKELEELDFSTLPAPVKHIGRGSNLLFTKDFPGTILHSSVDYIKYIDLGLDEVHMAVGAGVEFDRFVEEACKAPYWGAENLSLIPGEVGAAAVQNVGAYGAEVKDIIAGVVCLDTREHRKVVFKVGECGYGYRDSMFKRSGGRYIVTSVLFKLSRKYKPNLEYKGLKDALGGKEPESPMQVREAVCSLRRSKLPDPAQVGSAGSFFKNPVVDAATFARIALQNDTVPHYLLPGGLVKIPAAWMIEQCGLKGQKEGGAAVYDRQALVIVNSSGDAVPEDILRLEMRIVSAVEDRFGVELVPEVEHI